MKKKKTFSRSSLAALTLILSFVFASCSNTVYTHQNGTYYNDWEAVHHYKVQNASKGKKVKSMSKSPNWRRYNTASKQRRY
jgi:hypothetical protein